MIFPSISNGTVINGDVFNAPEKCKSCSGCNNISKSKPTIEKCKFGFSVGISDQKRVHPGLSIKGYIDKKKLKGKFDSKCLLTKEQFFSLCNSEKLNNVKEQKFESELEKNSLREEIHEVRQLNTQIQAQAERLTRILENNTHRTQLETNLSKNIYYTSSMISSRFLGFDLIENNQLQEMAKKRKMGIYKKFDKIRKIFIGCYKEPYLQFSGDTKDVIYATDIFDLLPFLIIDNARKYSPKSGTVKINFKKSNNTTQVEITNRSEFVSDVDLSHIFNQGYRGRNSNEKQGSGIGLCLAKKICEINKINIKAKCEKSEDYALDDFKYRFVVTLEFLESFRS